MRHAVGECHPWQQIVTSPMLRCAEFARELSDRWRIPLSVEERFREVGFGVWEGKTSKEIKHDDPLRIHRFRLEPERLRPEGAEPLEVFAERVGGAWEDLIQHYEGQHILVVAHAGVIRMILSRVLGIPLGNLYRIQVGNAAVSRVKIEGSGVDRLSMLEFHDGRL